MGTSEQKRRGDGLVARNKRASFEYQLEERFEAGLALLGSEVKVLRAGSADLSDAWVSTDGREAFVHGLNIAELAGAAFGHRGKRTRKLLLHAREIERIARAVQRDGMTAVAVSLYFKDGRAKLEIALAKGKKTVDKRHALRERDAARDAAAAMARARRGRS